MNWFTKDDHPPRFIMWLGGWLTLAQRVYDLERRVVELERARPWPREPLPPLAPLWREP